MDSFQFIWRSSVFDCTQTFQVKTSSTAGSVVFDNLSNGIYGIVADVSTINKNKTQLSTWNATPINMPESIPGYAGNNTIKFVFRYMALLSY